MKDKIIIFVIGILVGSVITTGAFFLYTKATTCNNNNKQIGMPGGNPPSMNNGQNNQNGQPPEKPSASNNENGQPAEQSNDNNNQNSNN